MKLLLRHGKTTDVRHGIPRDRATQPTTTTLDAITHTTIGRQNTGYAPTLRKLPTVPTLRFANVSTAKRITYLCLGLLLRDKLLQLRRDLCLFSLFTTHRLWFSK